MIALTVQENPSGPQLLMLLVVVATVILGVSIAVRAVARHPTGRLSAVLGAVIVLYSIALLGVGALSQATSLKPGDFKCFDEWCATMLGASASAGSLEVRTRLENHGRGAQRSVLARAFVEAGGQRYWPRNPDDLHVLVPGGGSVDVVLDFALPSPLASARFVVTEAASGQPTPGLIVIGDESSPFHSLAGWPVDKPLASV